VHRVRQIRLAVAATVPIERAQLIGGENVARHENRDTPTPSTAVRDCIRYKNALKLFIYLRINSKSVIARCAKWHKKSKYEAKLCYSLKLCTPAQNTATRQRLKQLNVYCASIISDQRIHAPHWAEQSQAAFSHEISRLQHSLE